jgi:hypothetical protein
MLTIILSGRRNSTVTAPDSLGALMSPAAGPWAGTGSCLGNRRPDLTPLGLVTATVTGTVMRHEKSGSP